MSVIWKDEVVAARRYVPVTMRSTVDGTPMTGESANIVVRVTKTLGGATIAASGAITEPDPANAPGDYLYQLTAAEHDTLGIGLVQPTLVGAFSFAYPFLVVPDNPFAGLPDADEVADAVATEIGTGAALTALASAADLATIAADVLVVLGHVDTEIVALQTAINALHNLSAAQVNAEVDQAIVDAALATAAVLDAVNTAVAAIKAKTDSLTFTKANEADVNIRSANSVGVIGTGVVGDLWRATGS